MQNGREGYLPRIDRDCSPHFKKQFRVKSNIAQIAQKHILNTFYCRLFLSSFEKSTTVWQTYFVPSTIRSVQ